MASQEMPKLWIKKQRKGVCADSQDSLRAVCNPHHLQVWSSHRCRLTCDIWGLKLISFRSTDPGDRLCNIWHRSTPSRRACAKSKTAAEGHTTRWFGGRTLQSINHRPHCLHSSISAPEILLTKWPESSNWFAPDWKRLFAAHKQALLSVPCLRPGVSFAISTAIGRFRNCMLIAVRHRTICPSQTHVSSAVATTWKWWRLEKDQNNNTASTDPVQQTASMWTETETSYGNFLLFILKNFSSHVQSKKAWMKGLQ